MVLEVHSAAGVEGQGVGDVRVDVYHRRMAGGLDFLLDRAGLHRLN